MSFEITSFRFSLAVSVAALAFGCEENAEHGSAAGTPGAATAAVASAPPPAPPPPPKPREDCPEGSSGIGTSSEPCKASGDSRMMEVKYTGKTTEQGPKFSVVNKATSPILYGSVVAYFYDKAGKQLEVSHGEKKRPMQTCSGNIFAGAVKPDEKIYVFFSCVKQADVPEGTAAIEAEVKTVGFTDEAGQKNEFYWSNPDLAPDARPKSDPKAKAKAKGKK